MGKYKYPQEKTPWKKIGDTLEFCREMLVLQHLASTGATSDTAILMCIENDCWAYALNELVTKNCNIWNPVSTLM